MQAELQDHRSRLRELIKVAHNWEAHLKYRSHM